jgi:hypothetical protein
MAVALLPDRGQSGSYSLGCETGIVSGPHRNACPGTLTLDRNAAKHLVAMVTEELPLALWRLRLSFKTSGTALRAGTGPLRRVAKDAVAVQIVDLKNDLKVYRPGAYPVVRGSAVLMRDRSAYLWTTGYVPRLDTYRGPETPNPISVRVLRGECPIETVLTDVLGLTKINFNSCLYNDRLPVTINFANEVGAVLISAPLDGEPRLPFKFYI